MEIKKDKEILRKRLLLSIQKWARVMEDTKKKEEKESIGDAFLKGCPDKDRAVKDGITFNF